MRTDFETGPAEFNREGSHAHLLVNFPPNVALSRLVNSCTGVSSRRTRQEFPSLRRHYYQANRRWSASCSAGSAGGPPTSAPRQHTDQQNQPA